ncbi:hypothetical protein B0J17DRAFT_704555 [Rhizoctonia solani]|nr:hypothetical protein B0J17DRAFT_704555 [Rhizoctonia solani]
MNKSPPLIWAQCGTWIECPTPGFDSKRVTRWTDDRAKSVSSLQFNRDRVRGKRVTETREETQSTLKLHKPNPNPNESAISNNLSEPAAQGAISLLTRRCILSCSGGGGAASARWLTGAVPSAIGGAAPLRWFGAGDWFWGCMGRSGLTFDSHIGWAILPRYWGSSASSGPLRSGLYELPMGESVGEETENSDSDSDSESVDSVDELLWSGVASRGGLSQSALSPDPRVFIMANMWEIIFRSALNSIETIGKNT